MVEVLNLVRNRQRNYVEYGVVLLIGVGIGGALFRRKGEETKPKTENNRFVVVAMGITAVATAATAVYTLFKSRAKNPTAAINDTAENPTAALNDTVENPTAAINDSENEEKDKEKK